MMQGTVIVRRRGRPRTAWIDNIKTWTAGLPVEESIRMTEDRDKWRKYVHGVAIIPSDRGRLRNRTEHLYAIKYDSKIYEVITRSDTYTFQNYFSGKRNGM